MLLILSCPLLWSFPFPASKLWVFSHLNTSVCRSQQTHRRTRRRRMMRKEGGDQKEFGARQDVPLRIRIVIIEK